MKLEFSGQMLKNTRISSVMKRRQMCADFFHADGRTDTTKLIVTFAILRTRLKIGRQAKLKKKIVCQ
jgi:hypothetical protein